MLRALSCSGESGEALAKRRKPKRSKSKPIRQFKKKRLTPKAHREAFRDMTQKTRARKIPSEDIQFPTTQLGSVETPAGTIMAGLESSEAYAKILGLAPGTMVRLTVSGTLGKARKPVEAISRKGFMVNHTKDMTGKYMLHKMIQVLASTEGPRGSKRRSIRGTDRWILQADRLRWDFEADLPEPKEILEEDIEAERILRHKIPYMQDVNQVWHSRSGRFTGKPK